jgi:hypothetical protein
MNNPGARILCLTTLCCAAATAAAQQPPAPTAQSEAGEPRADTSNPAPANATHTAPGTSGATAAGATGATAAAATAPWTGATATGTVAPAAGVARKPAVRTATASGAPAPAKIDRLDLGTATVTGDREQPKVMYIVPWKRSDIGDLAGKPMNSLVDEILAPVDRDVFKREVVYYQAVQADASQNGAPPKPAQQGEK